ncbi:hypothetical protein V9T40_007672 [Parthenolecanium corni]|uniref:Uncharacterized protein n=1 Tax=Parthenolecanium corni TaxID=536013 RepID=A0AAN9THI2_9HEMI
MQTSTRKPYLAFQRRHCQQHQNSRTCYGSNVILHDVFGRVINSVHFVTPSGEFIPQVEFQLLWQQRTKLRKAKSPASQKAEAAGNLSVPSESPPEPRFPFWLHRRRTSGR